MSYYLADVPCDPGGIAEGDHARGAQLRFTPFTSCIAVVARVTGSDELCGIHLVAMDRDGMAFGAADVPRVIAKLDAMTMAAGTGIVCGMTGVWSNPANGDLKTAYDALIAAVAPGQQFADQGDGTYTVTWNGSTIVIGVAHD